MAPGDYEFPEHLLYDLENQIWYQPLEDGTVRAGFTKWAAGLMGEILVFTPKRLTFDFDKGRSFAVVEGGKWVGSARAAFDGVVVSRSNLFEIRRKVGTSDAGSLRPRLDAFVAPQTRQLAGRPYYWSVCSTGVRHMGRYRFVQEPSWLSPHANGGPDLMPCAGLKNADARFSCAWCLSSCRSRWVS